MLKKNYMISILINNYNKEKFLHSCLESILSQSNKNYEVIFYDDRSTDNSVLVAYSFKKKFKKNRFLIIKNKKKKYLENSLNQYIGIKKSLKHCRGKYVSLLDSDDIMLPNKVEILNNYIKKDQSQFCCYLNSYFIKKTKKLIENHRHYKNRKILYPIVVPTSCITINKVFLKKFLKKDNFNKFLSCWLDFRLISYITKHDADRLKYINKQLNIYITNDKGEDFKYRNIFKNLYWKRKIDAILYWFLI